VDTATTPYRSCAPPSTILFREDNLLEWAFPATGVLVETLLDRGADGDVAEADRRDRAPSGGATDDGLVMREIWLLLLRALLARAVGGRSRAIATIEIAYRAMATALGFEGHIAWAAAMP